MILGDPAPWDPLDLPWDEMPDTPGVPRDRAARPSLDTVLELRSDRMATVRQVVDGLTEVSLDRRTEPVEGPVGPAPAATRCANACWSSSTKSGSTGASPSGTSMLWRHPQRSGDAGRILRAQPLSAVTIMSRPCFRVRHPGGTSASAAI